MINKRRLPIWIIGILLIFACVNCGVLFYTYKKVPIEEVNQIEEGEYIFVEYIPTIAIEIEDCHMYEDEITIILVAHDKLRLYKGDGIGSLKRNSINHMQCIMAKPSYRVNILEWARLQEMLCNGKFGTTMNISEKNGNLYFNGTIVLDIIVECGNQ